VTIGSVILAFVAGVLSILSPCVLRILPIALGAAASEHKWGRVVAIGALVLSGLDKSVEAALVATSPQRLTDLTTRF
jgi:cytochrome c-type biogenesis protein